MAIPSKDIKTLGYGEHVQSPVDYALIVALIAIVLVVGASSAGVSVGAILTQLIAGLAVL